MYAFLTWYTGFKSSSEKLALLFTLFFTNHCAIEHKNPGIPLAYFLHNSSVRRVRLAKGESRTKPAIEGSLSACNNAVTATNARPQSPIVLGRLDLRKYSTTVFKSSRSHHQREIYSPSELPEPLKSKQKKVIFAGRKVLI